MIDIGANLSNQQFKHDIAQVINQSIQSKLTHIVLTSTDIKTYWDNLNIIKKYNHLLPLSTTIGLHPHHADHYQEFFKTFDTLIQNPHVVSIGEFGLDYFRMLASKENQLLTMNLFMEKAKSHPLPLFMHERDASEDFVAVLKSHEHRNKKIVHCFTGNQDTVRKYLDLDCYIGITGWITEEKRGALLRDALQFIPLDKIMIETDSPYLTPKNMPTTIRRNEPSFLIYVATKIAELKKVTVEKVLAQTTHNAIDFFNLAAYNKSIANKIKIS